MIRKRAKVVGKEYIEYNKDEGPAHPSNQQEKSQEFQSELLPIKMGRTMSTQDLSYLRTSGMRLA